MYITCALILPSMPKIEYRKPSQNLAHEFWKIISNISRRKVDIQKKITVCPISLYKEKTLWRWRNYEIHKLQMNYSLTSKIQDSLEHQQIFTNIILLQSFQAIEILNSRKVINFQDNFVSSTCWIYTEDNLKYSSPATFPIRYKVFHLNTPNW